MRTETLFDRLARATDTRLFSLSFVALRVGIGLEFFYAGVNKFGDWSAAGYLQTADGPFAAWFQSLAGSVVVDSLNAVGLTLIGAVLIVGLLVRPAAIAGMVIMILYYLAHFTENTLHGYIDIHILHILVFFLFTAGGAGHMFGLNGLALQSLRKPGAGIRFLLG